jgi:hypothetical protein
LVKKIIGHNQSNGYFILWVAIDFHFLKNKNKKEPPIYGHLKTSKELIVLMKKSKKNY